MSRIIPDDDISDELVDLIIRHVSEPFWTDAIQMAREIQRRRAADLSPEEVEALRHIAGQLRRHDLRTPTEDRALATLSKLLGER